MNTDTEKKINAIYELFFPKPKTERPEAELGFGKGDTGVVWVYIGGETGWYLLADDESRTCIPEKTLKGFLTKVEVKAVTVRGKEIPKMHFHVNADKNYILRAGPCTVWAKGMIASVLEATPQQLAQPLTIGVSLGDSENVVFSSVTDSLGHRIVAELLDDDGCRAKFPEAAAKLKQIRSQQTT